MKTFFKLNFSSKINNVFCNKAQDFFCFAIAIAIIRMALKRLKSLLVKKYHSQEFSKNIDNFFMEHVKNGLYENFSHSRAPHVLHSTYTDMLQKSGALQSRTQKQIDTHNKATESMLAREHQQSHFSEPRFYMVDKGLSGKQEHVFLVYFLLDETQFAKKEHTSLDRAKLLDKCDEYAIKNINPNMYSRAYRIHLRTYRNKKEYGYLREDRRFLGIKELPEPLIAACLVLSLTPLKPTQKVQPLRRSEKQPAIRYIY